LLEREDEVESIFWLAGHCAPQVYGKELLTHLQEAFYLKHPEMFAAKGWVLLYDSATHQA
jgi:hypothetical protein